MSKQQFLKRASLTFLLTLILSGISFGQNWQTDFQQTLQTAKAKDQPIILVFSGSDWCAPCMKLENEIWSSDEFKNYSAEHFVLYNADFPRKKKNQPDSEQVKANKALAEKYNTKGFFPLVVVLDKTGKVLGETGYKKLSPNEYIKHLETFVN
ncbi:thioredoxin family protein [Draconibacterium halophilum]|uniref:Thioredoxin family protein n=1 Tax=Draconibacterium halophilum TaxID=2706887 RepID=A0A6C0RG26_9BACT|nr:thioredoxin family protein [Draconibacterium halophilum]QIA08782.1 thioredoxin family protein [Draconibacterium halophilum]